MTSKEWKEQSDLYNRNQMKILDGQIENNTLGIKNIKFYRRINTFGLAFCIGITSSILFSNMNNMDSSKILLKAVFGTSVGILGTITSNIALKIREKKHQELTNKEIELAKRLPRYR